jgi:YidC/Oxa1 family membrane protein insertase
VSGFSHILDPISHPLGAVLIALTGVLHNYGLAIIVFTILVRGVLSPLNIKQLKSARKMASLGPLQKELQRRYKGDRAALQQATMELYKEQGVNPAAGCLPLLVQMPILYSLIFVFSNIRNLKNAHGAYIAIYHTNFLWFSLDKPDSLFGHFFFGAHSFWGPLPVLAAATQWVQQRMMMQPTSDPQQRSTQQIMQFMPLMIMLFAVNYPSGLALYWVTSTVFSIVMQYFITGFGQLFKSPFKVPEAVAAPSPALSAGARSKAGQSATGSRAIATRANGNGASANGTKANGNGHGRRVTLFSAHPPSRVVEDAEDEDLTGDERLAAGGTGARQGKMQRTVARQKARPPKGVRR